MNDPKSKWIIECEKIVTKNQLKRVMATLQKYGFLDDDWWTECEPEDYFDEAAD